MTRLACDLDTSVWRMDGLEVRPYAYLANTKFAFLDLN